MRKMKMRTSVRIPLLACLWALPGLMRGQQEAMNAQYIMNKLFINPAYAGYREQPNLFAVHRSQWVGFKGAPMTTVAGFDSPLKKDEFAIGGTLIFDKLGPQTKSGMTVDFAYRTRLTNRATLSFGAKASAELYQANLTDLYLTSDYNGLTDEAFMYNTRGVFLPNIGFGAFYYKKDHYVGISIPRMIRNRLERRGTTEYELLDGRQEPTLILTGGKIYKVNKQIKIQPNIVIRSVWGAPMSIGIFGNVMILDQVNLGIFTHVGESAGLMFQWQINKQFKIGYSFDVATSALITTNYGSHELSSSFILPTRKKRIIYPRYF